MDTMIQIDSDIVFSSPIEDKHDAEDALTKLGANWIEQTDLGKVSVVGAGMRSNPGVAANAFATLRSLGIEPRYVSTSPIKIAFFVPHDDVERAVRGAARNVRAVRSRGGARPCLTRASASSARPARSEP